MNAWGAIQFVGTGLSLVAFGVAAILYAYRARLAHRAEIIRSAPEKERLEAIALTVEFFRVDVSRLTRAQQQEIALTQIHARARRDLPLAGLSLAVAILLAAIARCRGCRFFIASSPRRQRPSSKPGTFMAATMSGVISISKCIREASVSQ